MQPPSLYYARGDPDERNRSPTHVNQTGCRKTHLEPMQLDVFVRLRQAREHEVVRVLQEALGRGRRGRVWQRNAREKAGHLDAPGGG